MNTRRSHQFFVLVLPAFLLVSLLTSDRATAATILNVVQDPPTTAGGGSTSTRSGPGSFHIYAIDTANFGIANYSLSMGAAVTASNNRSPVTNIQDTNGDVQTAGFSLLRSSSNVNPIVASQNLAGQTPYLYKGFGVNSGSFAAISAADPGSSVVGPTTSAAWGGSYENGTLGAGPGGRAWMLLAEGLYNGTAINTSVSSILAAANILVYANNTPGDFTQTTSPATPCALNGCAAPVVTDAMFDNVNANFPGLLMHTFTSTPPFSISWGGFAFDSFTPAPGESGTGPSSAATFDPATAKFSWNTVGSPLGTYKWLVTATNSIGSDQGSITVRITAVPEPTTLSLFTISIAGIFSATRHRRA